MAANTPQNYFTLGQAPLDAKMIFKNKSEFDAIVLANPAVYGFNFYKGMLVYFQEEEKFYIWESPFSEFFKESEKLLDQNYIYPAGSVYDGVDYSGKAFNFLEFSYQKENIGVWDLDDEEPTLEVTIYAGSTVNPFNVSDVLAIWPNAEKLSFIDGDLTGLKLYGQTIQLFQEFPVADWDQLTYDIWNSAPNFEQIAKLRIIEPGEIVDYSVYDGEIVGNSFKEVRIVHDNISMKNKSSIYFKAIGDTFEIHITDKLNQKRILSASGSDLNKANIDGSNISQYIDMWKNILGLAEKADLISGKIPLSQLPFGDDVLEFNSINDFPNVGSEGKFYISLLEDKSYTWDGFNNEYVLSSGSFFNIQNTDNSLKIEAVGNNVIVNSNTSIFEENFYPQANDDPYNCNVSFVPVQVLGVFRNGIKLKDNDYVFTPPSNFDFSQIEVALTHLNIQYRYQIN